MLTEKQRLNLLTHADDMAVSGYADDAKALRELIAAQAKRECEHSKEWLESLIVSVHHCGWSNSHAGEVRRLLGAEPELAEQAIQRAVNRHINWEDYLRAADAQPTTDAAPLAARALPVVLSEIESIAADSMWSTHVEISKYTLMRWRHWIKCAIEHIEKESHNG